MVDVYRMCWLVAGAAVVLGGCSDKPPEMTEAVRKKMREAQIQSPYSLRTNDRGDERDSSEPARDRRVLRTRDELSVNETASVALGRIGEAAVPGLTQGLHHPQPEVRRQAAETLARIGPASAPAVPDLIRALSDEDLLVRRAATRALGQVGPAAADAVPALLRIMQERAASSAE